MVAQKFKASSAADSRNCHFDQEDSVAGTVFFGNRNNT